MWRTNFRLSQWSMWEDNQIWRQIWPTPFRSIALTKYTFSCQWIVQVILNLPKKSTQILPTSQRYGDPTHKCGGQWPISNEPLPHLYTRPRVNLYNIHRLQRNSEFLWVEAHILMAYYVGLDKIYNLTFLTFLTINILFWKSTTTLQRCSG